MHAVHLSVGMMFFVSEYGTVCVCVEGGVGGGPQTADRGREEGGSACSNASQTRQSESRDATGATGSLQVSVS